jgi:hypothetical protein
MQLLRLRAVPVVGREVERDLLDSFAKDVCRNRRARLLVLLGEAGVGKSRLAEWLLARVERDGVMEGVAAAYDWAGPGVAGGLRAAFRRLLGVAGEAASPTRSTRRACGSGSTRDRAGRFRRCRRRSTSPTPRSAR